MMLQNLSRQLLLLKRRKIFYLELGYHYLHLDLKQEIDFIIHSLFHLLFVFKYCYTYERRQIQTSIDWRFCLLSKWRIFFEFSSNNIELLVLFSQILHYWKYYKNEIPSYLKPLEMIFGLVSSKSIGLLDREDINELLKNYKIIIQVSKFVSFVASFSAFCKLVIPSIINSLVELYLIEIF